MKENINKYYTPEYSDIYIGQDLYTINGHKINLSTVDSLTAFLQYQNYYKDCEGNITYGINLENYRLKYLDSSDIEEEGFKKDIYIADVSIRFKYEKYTLIFNTKTNLVRIALWKPHTLFNKEFLMGIDVDYQELFCGIIKNKSELKKVLNMLNIK